MLMMFSIFICNSHNHFNTSLSLSNVSNDIDLSDIGRLHFRRTCILNNEVASLYWKGLDNKIYYKNVDIGTYNQVCRILIRSGKDFTIANFIEEYDKLWENIILGQYRPEIEFNSELIWKSIGVISGTILYAIFLMEIVDRIYFPIK